MANLKQAKTEEQVKALTVSGVKKAYNELSSDYNKLINLEYIYCPCCGSFKARSNFYTSKRTKSGIEHLGCKACVLDMATNYNKATKERTDNREKTIEVLRRMDLPFIETTYKAQLSLLADNVAERQTGTAFQQFLTLIKSLPQYNNKTFADSEFALDDMENNDEESQKIVKKTLKMAKKRFGAGLFTNEDLMFLENEYQDWITRYECGTKVQEDLFQMLAINKWEKRRALLEGRSTKDLDKTYQDLLSSGNLLPRQSSNNSLADSLTFGQLIEKWEEEEPIPDPDPEFKDVNSIGKYIRVWFAGHLSRCLGLDNGYAREYDEYIKQYTVTKPNYDEEEVATTTYNKLFGNKEV